MSFDRNKMWREIAENTVVPRALPYMFTARQYASRTDRKSQAARRNLEEMVAEGIIESGQRRLESGHHSKVFWRPEDREEYEREVEKHATEESDREVSWD